MKNNNKKDSKPTSRKRYQAVDQTRTFEMWVNKQELENSLFFGFLVHIDRKFSLKNLVLWGIFSLCFAFLLFAKFDYQPNIYEGEIATSDIKSPVNFTMVDVNTTQTKKESANKKVLSVFRYQPVQTEKQLDQIYLSFSNFRKKLLLKKDKDIENLKEEFEKSLDQKISDRTFEWLIETGFSIEIGTSLRAVLENWSSSFLADSPEKYILPGQDKISLLSTYRSKTDETTITASSIKDIFRRSVLKEDVPLRLKKLSKIDQKKILELAFDLLRPNIVYDEELTVKRRKNAVEEILPATVTIKKNQTIVNAGSIITMSDVQIVNQIRKLQYDSQRGSVPIGIALLFFVFILIGSNLITTFKKIEGKLDYRINILFLVSLVCLALWKVFSFVFETTLLERFGNSFPADVLVLASPFAAPVIIAGLITRSPYLLFVFSLFTSMSFAILEDQSFPTFMIVSLANLAALRLIYDCENRNDIYKSGFMSAFVAFIVSAIFAFVNQPDSLLVPQTWLWIMGAAVMGAGLSSILTFILVPIIENIFEITTDLKFLDLASMNHPLLKELIVKAPGTYHHSMVVGSMCESAAREIGANALMNKVMGYFHDIGKMEHPTYFIENQRPGENPHDYISPNLSKTIIMAHVKDGAEMALKAKLGKEILDGIKQHHGTTMISYFYNRAVEKADDPDSVKAEEFRYAGPKPQFKESAILMVADSIEAAARSLDDPSPMKLDHLVENMVEKKFMDQQLDECDLNFEELTIIKKAFYRVLLGVYHHRVEYPGQKDKKIVNKSANA